MAAVAALLTSCSKDDTFGGPARGKVTFEVSTPELATRAYGDGKTANNLYYAVYDVSENAMVKTNYGTTDNVTIGNDLKATVTIDLVEGRQYEVAFWAESANSPYTFDAEAKTVRYTNINDLDANMEDYDAFFAYVPKEQVVVGSNVSVTLKRPFAQLNVATNDTQKASALGVTVKQTGVKVYAYTSFDLKSGDVIGEKKELTFDMKNVGDDTATEVVEHTLGTITANSNNYDWLTMNYILVNERETTDVTFLFEDNKGKKDYTRPYAAVSVQRNHRTNIIGAILTDPTAFYVDINPVMDNPTYVIGDYLVGDKYFTDLDEAVAEAIDAENPLTLNLVQDAWYDAKASIEIPADKSLTINLNGHTLCGDADGDLAYLFVIEDGGTLIIDGAVITRGGASDTDGTISSSTGIFHVTGGTLKINNAIIKSSNIPVHVKNTDEAAVTIKDSTLIGGSDDEVAFWVDNDANLDKLTLDIFGADNNDFDGDISFGSGDSPFTANPETGFRTDTPDIYWDGYSFVGSWEEFTAALADNRKKVKLTADITYDANYQLQKSVTIDLNGKSMTLPMINIHTKTTIKNGTINGKVYARKNSEIVFNKVTFSGAVADNLSTEGHLAIQGGCKSLYAKDCLFSPTSVSGSQTKPLSFEGGSSNLKFENCEFKSSPYKKQVYFNSLSATAKLDFTNCNFNNKTPNIMFAAAAPLTNLTMSGTTKLGSVTLETNRAKDAVTADDLAYLREMIASNSFSSFRLFYAGGSSEYIR